MRDKSIHIDVKFEENAEILKFVKRTKMFGKVAVKKDAVRFNLDTEETQKGNDTTGAAQSSRSDKL